jgi:hypothetical protein
MSAAICVRMMGQGHPLNIHAIIRKTPLNIKHVELRLIQPNMVEFFFSIYKSEGIVIFGTAFYLVTIKERMDRRDHFFTIATINA